MQYRAYRPETVCNNFIGGQTNSEGPTSHHPGTNKKSYINQRQTDTKVKKTILYNFISSYDVILESS